MPEGQPMPSRLLEQQRYIAFRRRQIANEQGDWARRLDEDVTQQKLVFAGQSVRETALGRAHALIRKSLKKKNTRKGGTRGHPLVKLKADRMQPANGGDIATEHMFEMGTRVRLVPQVMQRGSGHSLTNQ